jgi:hypothetical protein
MMIGLNKKLIGFLEQNHCPDINEALVYLLACKHELKTRVSEEVFEFLQKKNLIKLNLVINKIVPLTAIYEGEEFELSVDDNLKIEEEIKQRVDEYRQLFKGIRSNSIGVKSKVVEMLTKFCIENSIDFDTVVLSTNVYMQYVDNIKLVPNADNFISKLDKDGNEVSLLKMAIEEQSMDSNTDVRTYKVI